MKITLLILALTLPLSSLADITTLNLRYEPIQPLLKPENLDARKVELGQQLFNETLLSRDSDMSCASCHNLNDNGASHDKLSKGRSNTLLDANTLTVFNSSLNHQQFWNGRASTLEKQIDFVLTSEKEFASNWGQVIKKLNNNKDYRRKFNTLYPTGITADNIRNAIVTFEHSLITSNSRFDQYLLGDVNAINSQEKRGYRLFKSYGCVACHQGQNVGGNMYMKFGVFGNYYSDNKKNATTQDFGRYNITGDESDRYVFRVPALRLAAITAPYFHDGSVETLQLAIKIMARHQLGRSISEQHINDIVAFLKALPGDYQGQALIDKKHPQQQSQ